MSGKKFLPHDWNLLRTINSPTTEGNPFVEREKLTAMRKEIREMQSNEVFCADCSRLMLFHPALGYYICVACHDHKEKPQSEYDCEPYTPSLLKDQAL